MHLHSSGGHEPAQMNDNVAPSARCVNMPRFINMLPHQLYKVYCLQVAEKSTNAGIKTHTQHMSFVSKKMYHRRR